MAHALAWLVLKSELNWTEMIAGLTILSMYKVSLDPAIFGSLNKWSTSIKVTGKASKKGRFKDTLYIE